MKHFIRKIFCAAAAITVLFFAASTVSGNDEDANAAAKQASALAADGEHEKAAKKYLDAVLLADDAVLKSNSLQSAALSYRRAGLYGKEFDCIQRLIGEHISRIDFQKAVTREYEIASLYFDGYRDTYVSWLPFIHDADRTEEFYKTALENAACAPQAPEARLRLGMMYLDEDEPEKAIERFKELLTLHPDTLEARYAYLEMAATYTKLSQLGDGDGAWAELALTTLREFLKKYPNDPEVPWVKKSIETVRTTQAKREHGIGLYYHRIGRDDLAQRYMREVIVEHGATQNSIESERLLAEIDKTYVPPPPDAPREEPVKFKYSRHTIPLERDPVMVVPENSEGKWLLPIRDMKADIQFEQGQKKKERKFDDEDL